MKRSDLKPPALARLRCKVHGHLYLYNGIDDPLPSNANGGYVVHLSCLRCWKEKVLTRSTGSINMKRSQE